MLVRKPDLISLSITDLFLPNTHTVDYLKITAGDIALSYNNAAIYNVIRDAGIRSGASMP